MNGLPCLPAFRPDAVPGACHRCRRPPFPHLWRTFASRQARRARSSRAVNRGGIRPRASRSWSANNGRDPGWPTHARRAGVAAPRRGGHRSARGGMPDARLYRRHFCCPHLRRQAWLCRRPKAGVSRDRGSQSRDGVGTRLSGGRRPVTIGRKRQGWRPHAACPCLCLRDARALPPFPHRASWKTCQRRSWPRSSCLPYPVCWISRPCSACGA